MASSHIRLASCPSRWLSLVCKRLTPLVTMSMAAPRGRKHLSADALFRLVRNDFARILDDRAEATGIALADALMAAFAMFSLKSPSLLTFDKERVEGNLQTIYGIEHAPCDSYMRELIDPVSPESLRPAFTGVFRQLQRGKALEPMMFLHGRSEERRVGKE